MKNIKFIGQITTVAPVVVTLPNQSGIPKNAQGSYYIPATSLRGMLRSVASHAISSLLHANGKKLSVDDIYMMFSGVDTGRKNKLGGGYEILGKNLEVRQTNPQISSFGNFSIAGKLKMGNAFCDKNSNPVSKYGNGSRNHPFNRNQNLFNFVQEDELAYLKGIMEADALTSLETADLKDEKVKLKNQLKQVSGDEKKEIFNQIEDIDKKIKDAKNARTGSTESILRPLDGFDAIDPDQNLDHRFTLTNPDDNELQFLLWVLYKASVDFRVGGHQNLGCGDIHGHWVITETSFENPQPTKLGELTINDDGFQLTGIEFNPQAIESAIIDGTFDFSMY